MRLVYLSPVPWESFAQRPHKFVEWFHGRTGRPVLWVDPYPTRFPHWTDLLRSRLSASACQRTNPPTWLTLLKPGGLPIEPLPGSGWANRLLWQDCLKVIGDFVEGGRTLLAIGKPSVFALELLNRLRDCPSLYDAMDDFPAFYSGLSRIALRRTERKIIERVAVVLASSSALKSRWVKFHTDVRLVRNALDLSVLKSVEPALKCSNKSVFGYVGTIASWFDWEWVCALADARPFDEIRLIGPAYQRPPRKLPSNIHLMPACVHAQAMRAMSEFHVGLIPFKKNALTASVDPIKYYEYRALGLPVISTDFGEMRFRSEEKGVFITYSISHIPAAADSAIRFNDQPCEVSRFAQQNAWECRFDSAEIFAERNGSNAVGSEGCRFNKHA